MTDLDAPQVHTLVHRRPAALTAGWYALVVAVVLSFTGVVLWAGSSFLFLWVAGMTVVRTVISLARLGRVERARALAEVLPDAPARTAARSVRPGRPGTRSGSKIALPGDDR